VLDGIARGEKAIDEDRVATHAQAEKRLARWLKQHAQPVNPIA